MLATTIWGIITLIAVLYVIVDSISNEKMSTGTKIIWILVALILGIIGAIIYYFFGKKNSDYRITKRKGR